MNSNRRGYTERPETLAGRTHFFGLGGVFFGPPTHTATRLIIQSVVPSDRWNSLKNEAKSCFALSGHSDRPIDSHCGVPRQMHRGSPRAGQSHVPLLALIAPPLNIIGSKLLFTWCVPKKYPFRPCSLHFSHPFFGQSIFRRDSQKSRFKKTHTVPKLTKRIFPC